MSNGKIKKGQTGRTGTPDESSQAWSKNAPWHGKVPGHGGDYYEWEGDPSVSADITEGLTSGGVEPEGEDIESGFWNDPNLFPGGTTTGTSSQGTGTAPSPDPYVGSTSNIGTTSYSGSSKSSAVTGGFTPLPPVVGNEKKLFQVSKFHGGLNVKNNPSDLGDAECSDAKNVSFSQIGTIRLLGDFANEDNTNKEFAALDTGANLPGYGLYEFTAPVDQDGTAGIENILLTADGNQVDTMSVGGGTDTGWIVMGGTSSTAAAQIYHSSGSGVYVADAAFVANNDPKARVYVYRKDFNGLQTTAGWGDNDANGGKFLIDSPRHTTSANTAGAVFLDFDDGSVAFPGSNLTSTYGATTVHIGSSGSTGTWTGDYAFYISWLFDNGCETGLSALQASGGSTFAGEILSFNFSCKAQWNESEYIAGTPDNSQHIGLDNDNTHTVGEPRIEGARIYFKLTTENERFLLAEVSLVNGIKGAEDTTFVPWTEASNVFYLSTNLTFDTPPTSSQDYFSLNGFFPDEAYAASKDVLANDTTGPVQLSLKYKAVTTAPNGIIFIGNVEFDGKYTPDLMMASMPGRPNLFPRDNRFDSPSSDGSPITALASFGDRVLQFKESALYIINVASGPEESSGWYVEDSYANCGVFNPCQVFDTPYGIAFANKYGAYNYDGEKVTNLGSDKFIWGHGGDFGAIFEESASNESTGDVPCVGYDPVTQNLIILQNIGDDSASGNSVVYNFPTQSWSRGSSTITNANGRRHTNMIVTSEKWLSIKRDNDQTLQNYNGQPGGSGNMGRQTITYRTKEFDFGFPSQTKHIYKIYITFRGDVDAVYLLYGINGDTSPTESDLLNEATGTIYLTDQGAQSNGLAVYKFSTHPDNLRSIRIHISNFLAAQDANAEFEINDIAFLYRLRPIK